MATSLIMYHVLAFFSGAVVLVLEVLGARIIAPYLGSAFFVWVNVIGVMLAALSVGYWLGGALADRNQKLLPFIFFVGAWTVAFIPLERTLLPSIGTLGLRIGSLIASLVLFAPSSVVLGMVSPYLVRLAAQNTSHLGRAAGSIFSASTMGSIAGTFVAGFLLIPHFSVTHIIWGMVGVLCMLALASWPHRAVIAFFLLPCALLAVSQLFASRNAKITLETNSQYYNIRVHDAERSGGVTERTLLLDGSPQSARYIGREGMPFSYVELSAQLITALKPAPGRVLALGGGGYSIPAFIKKRWPQSSVTVVEIDPMVTYTAERFFLDTPLPDIATVSQDARVFLNNNHARYNLVYTDAYAGAFAVPGHLVSREAFMRTREALSPDGIAIFNIASALNGMHAQFFKALYHTLSTVFTDTIVFATAPAHPELPQNIIVVAANKKHLLTEDALTPFEPYRVHAAPDTHDALLLTDDFAPTDHLVEGLVETLYPSLRQYQR